MAEKTLVGFKRFKSKKGSPLCVALVARKFTAQENDRGSFGCDMDSVFVPSEQYDYLEVSDIGKPVDLQYDIVSGRAYLRSITVDRGAAAKGILK